MNLNDYQKRAIPFSVLSREANLTATSPSYVAKILGLVGEAGEVAEKYKKIIRDKDGVLTESDVTEITKELGDVLWYVAVLADYLGVTLEEVAETNIAKLDSRKNRGTQNGAGDNR